MSDRHTCEFCEKNFSTKKILRDHQKKAKYCLQKQEKLKKMPGSTYSREEFVRLLERNKFIEKELADSRREVSLLKSENSSLKEELNNSLKEANSRLESMLREQISRPSTVVNGNLQTTNKITNGIENFVTMMQPITNEHLTDQAKYLQREHIEQGAEGYARYALEYPLKDRVVCTDFSRRKLQYKNDKGHVIQDPDMRKLSRELFNAIETRNETLINEYTKELMDMMKFDDSPVLVEIMSDMCALRRDVHKMARGEKSELSKSFVKDICSKVSTSSSSSSSNEMKQIESSD